MTTCHHCGEDALHKLGDTDVCYDCSVRLKGVAEDSRDEFLEKHLTTLMQYVRTMPDSSVTKAVWLEELSRRHKCVSLKRSPPTSEPLNAQAQILAKGPLKVKLKKVK